MKKIVIFFILILLVGCSKNIEEKDKKDIVKKNTHIDDIFNYEIKFLTMKESKIFIDSEELKLDKRDDYIISGIKNLTEGKHDIEVKTKFTKPIRFPIEINETIRQINIMDFIKDMDLELDSKLNEKINENLYKIGADIYNIALNNDEINKSIFFRNISKEKREEIAKQIAIILDLDNKNYNSTKYINTSLEDDFELLSNNKLKLEIDIFHKYELKDVRNVNLDKNESISIIIDFDNDEISILDVEV